MKCNKKDCKADAHLTPVISFASKVKPDGPRVEARLGLLVCREHATDDATQYVGDEGWAQIVAAIKKQGRAYPDRKTLQVRYVPLA